MKRGTLTPAARMSRLERRIARYDARMAELERAGEEVPRAVREKREALVAEFVSIGVDGYASTEEEIF